jgi:hypothetical protein
MNLSALGDECIAMNAFEPRDFGPVLSSLIDTDRRRLLQAGSPRPEDRDRLRRVSIEDAFAHTKLADHDMARCCLAALWLLYDFLDESHEMSQRIDTPSGSFWHAIMHRREGDFANAKYWLRRIGNHEVLGPLAQRAGELAATRGEVPFAARPNTSGEFDPLAFVDLVESVERGQQPSARELILDIQQAEWELLFDACYRGAVA